MPTVCVTGASGFLGSHVTSLCLKRGFTVHATIRTPGSKSSEHVTSEILDPEGKGVLKVFSNCDLLVKGSFDEAVENCDVVMHTASPFMMGNTKNPYEVFVKPALEGTKNVLNSCVKHNVKHVVLTSSIVAVLGDKNKPDSTSRVYDENDWNTNDKDGYPWSKLVAEKKAWEMSKEHGFKLSTVNPALIVGPPLSSRSNEGTFDFINNLINGTWSTAANVSCQIVDVRDVAEMHVRAMETGVSGRFIACENSYFLPELGKMLSDRAASENLKLPKRVVPAGVVKLLGGCLGMPKNMRANVGKHVRLSSDKAKKELGVEFLSTKQSLNDMLDVMIEKKMR